jgi:hypothetical protein
MYFSDKPGLWIDSEFRRGWTGRCSTFQNDPLTESEDFSVAVAELWSFDSGF